MAIVTFPKFYSPPVHYSATVSPGAFGSMIVNASGEKAAVLFQAPKTGNIRKIGVRITSITTGTDTDFRLETVSGQNPTGTLFGTTTNLVVASASLVADAMNIVTMTADAAVTIGDRLAIVFAPAGTPDMVVSSHNLHSNSTYANLFTGPWTKQTSGAVGLVEYDDGTYAYINGLIPIDVLNTTTFSSNDTPDHIGMKFKFPKDVRVSGGWLGVDLDSSMDMVLIDSDGTTILATASLTNDLRRATIGQAPFVFSFATPQTLTADTYYYLAAKPGTSGISVFSFDAPSAPALEQYMGILDAMYSSAKDPTGTGDWTDITTRMPFMGLELDGL